MTILDYNKNNSYNISKYFSQSSLSEYGTLAGGGGTWYYTQNKPGTKWYDFVNNEKGWTIDFNLKVVNIENSNFVLDEDREKGIGIYINDGIRKESLTFLTQEIIFQNSQKKITYDTTTENDYRLIGKKNELKLYSKNINATDYSLIANVGYNKIATMEGNGLKPSVFEDSNNNTHTVWYDDGNGTGQIFYSKYSNEKWSDPELIINDARGAQYPDIIVDDLGFVYVTYESKTNENTSIGFIYKNNLGWGISYYLGTNIGESKHPKLAFDSKQNINIVWQDNRDAHPEIYIDKFIQDTQQLLGENKLTTTEYGAYRPSISSYLDELFISWTLRNKDETYSISIIKYNSLTSSILATYDFLCINNRADYSDILVNVNGKICIVWHDNVTGKYKIYGFILSTDLNIIIDCQTISEGKGGAQYPVLGEQRQTGDIYIVWEDYAENYREFAPLDPYLINDPYTEADLTDREPKTRTIYVAYYDNLNGIFYCSGNNSFDVKFSFNDERSARFPSIPESFSGEISVIYQTFLVDEYGFLNNNNLFSQIRNGIYDLTREPTYLIYNSFDSENPSTTGVNRDILLSGKESRKEIRFGDFSDTTNCNFIMKNFKYYLDDAVPPFNIQELSKDDFSSLEALSVNDVSINNYGDIWIVGTCGVMFYINSINNIIVAGSDSEIIGPIQSLNSFKVIAFDKHNYLVIGGENGIYYSTEHINGFNLLLNTIDVRALVFDKDNTLFVGTASGLEVYNVSENDGVLTTSIKYISGKPSSNITSIKVDDNNVVWIGSDSGVYRYYNNKFLNFTIQNGLPSNHVNDIAIRNTAIRYIATSNGIGKMMGSNFDNNISSDNDNIYNNNVKSLVWKDPNILWAGTLSKINQILVDDINNTYTTLVYEPNLSFTKMSNDLEVFYIIPDINHIINDQDIIDVFINGNLISHGYIIGYDKIVEKRLIKFDTPLLHDDIVEILVRKDLELRTSFRQSISEKKLIGSNLTKIKDISIAGEDIYLVTKGDENKVNVSDSTSLLPFDKIHLDTFPPTGIISIAEQISRNIVKVNITNVRDEYDGSGVDSMIISNYSNFTTNGFTSQDSIPFASTINHDIGISLEQVVKQLEFTEGKGSKIKYFSDTQELYAGVSQPAFLYKYNIIEAEWEKIITYDEEKFIDFIAKYNNKLIVSVGGNNNVATLYVYDYNIDKSLTLFHIYPIFESRAYCYVELNNLFYIGSGVGLGTEYDDGSGAEGGKVYVFDGTTIEEVVKNIDQDVLGLIATPTSNNLIAATGPSGYLYEIDINEQIAFITYNDIEPISAISYIRYNDQDIIFIGGMQQGTIRRSLVDSNSYDISFRTLPSEVHNLTTYTDLNNTSTLYMSVGKVIYYLSEGGSWIWKYTHTEDISDITVDINNDILYAISDNSITKITPIQDNKNIYLKLIDRAGNETVLYDNAGNIKQNLIASISIGDLIDFVNENKIYELDEVGNVVFNLRGNSEFYSGNRIIEERGVYESEIFNGSNQLAKWETISWEATELINTSVLLYIRTSNSQNDILLEDWVGPYTNSQSSGVDISSFSGQYIQFKVKLTSKEKGTSPSFHKAVIRAITSKSQHFFTTNFVLPSAVRKGILTSQKILPIAADIIFGINTTDSIDWSEYQIVEENRLFNVNNIGEDMRVGIKFITPNRSSYTPTPFDEYGPYSTNLFANTINFDYINNTGSIHNYHFKISLYNDINLKDLVYAAYSYESQDGFSINGNKINKNGYEIAYNEQSEILFVVPGSSSLRCDQYYFVKIETIYNIVEEDFILLSDTWSFVSGCSSSFVDSIDFNFTNNEPISYDYNFRIKFYSDQERTNEFLTIFSGNDRSGWFVDDNQMSKDGVTVDSGKTINVLYRPNLEQFIEGKTYYLIIEAHDGINYVFATYSYTFQARDIQSLEYCGGYTDVPIVKNFGIMLELENNEFITLNI